MLTIHPPFRRTTVDDAGTLADLTDFASEGLALYLWTKIAGPGRDPWHIGRERVLSETNGLSYRNALIAEVSGKPPRASSVMHWKISLNLFQTSFPQYLYRCTNS